MLHVSRRAVVVLALALSGFTCGSQPRLVDVNLRQPSILPQDWHWALNTKTEVATPNSILRILDASQSAIDVPLECEAKADLTNLVNALYEKKEPSQSKFFNVSDMPLSAVTFASDLKEFDANLGVEVSKVDLSSQIKSGSGKIRLAVMSASKAVQANEAFKNCIRSSLAGRGKKGIFTYTDEFMVGAMVVLEFEATSMSGDFDTSVAPVGELKAKADLNKVRVSFLQYGATSGLSAKALVAPLQTTDGKSADPLATLGAFQRAIQAFNTIATRAATVNVE